jgi:hypothetical protein
VPAHAFAVGERVEVMNLVEGLTGCWFGGTVEALPFAMIKPPFEGADHFGAVERLNAALSTPDGVTKPRKA